MASRQRSAQVAGDGTGPRVPAENILLSLLPDEDSAMIVASADRVSHDVRDNLFNVGNTIERVYFPIGGMASLVTRLSDGTSIEAMTVGVEGFVGLPLFHGVRVHRMVGICQIKGEFYAISAEKFTELLQKLGDARVRGLLQHRGVEVLQLTAEAQPRVGLQHRAENRLGYTIVVGRLVGLPALQPPLDQKGTPRQGTGEPQMSSSGDLAKD